MSRFAGADPGFQVRRAHLKKIAPSGGRRETFWVFRVKNHDFTPKNHIFSNFRGRTPGAPPLDPPLDMLMLASSVWNYNVSFVNTLFHYSGVQHILRCVFVVDLFVFILCTQCRGGSRGGVPPLKLEKI